MTKSFDTHHRHSIRLRGYDYAQPGAYFVTIVAAGRECLFGEIVNGVMRLNEAGKIAAATWGGLPQHFRNIDLDEFVVMPNHLHGIVVIVNEPERGRGEAFAQADASRCADASANASPLRAESDASPLQTTPSSIPRGTSPRSLSAIVQNFKSVTARQAHRPLWQRGFYEHVIRDEGDLERIREYIRGNPGSWEADQENPHKIAVG